MRNISKLNEPDSLTLYKRLPDAIYDGPNFTPVKNAIRKKLLEEQGYLCAYCMGRIELHSMRIEHWRCQDTYPDEQLNYKNMLGTCTGNEGLPYSEETCDVRKKNADIAFNPSDMNHHKQMKIIYYNDGTIGSENTKFNNDIEKLLNLNYYRLIQNRYYVRKAIINVIAKSKHSITKTEIQNEINKWSHSGNDKKFMEYCDVVLYYLNKKLKRITYK
jgi:uncharacterized protein (TIGR02646 family)